MGLCIVGFATAMIVIPIFPEMLHSIEEKFPQLRGDELNNVSSGYFNSFLGVGEAIGPICASVLTHNFGFRSSEDILGSVLCLYCIFFFLLCGRFDIFQFAKAEDNVLPEDTDDMFAKVTKQGVEYNSSGSNINVQVNRSGSVVGEFIRDSFIQSRLSASGKISINAMDKLNSS